MKKLILLSLCLFGMRVLGQVPAYVPTVSLLGWWPLDNNLATDLSINANNGTPMLSPTPIVGHLSGANTAFHFNGTNYIEVPDDPTLSGFNDMSISFWVRTNNPTGVAGLVTKWFQDAICNGNGDTYGVWISPNSFINYTNNNDVFTGFTSPPALSAQQLGQWTHVVVTSSSTGGQNMYFNAVLVATNGLFGNICSTTGPLIFAAESQTHTPNRHRFFDGDLDDIGIWSRVLTLCEIENLFRSSFLYQNTLYGSVVPSVNNVTLCANTTTSTTLSVNVSYGPNVPITYNWYSGNPAVLTSTLQSPVVSPTVSTVYTVVTGSPGQCPGHATVSVLVTCCYQQTTCLTPLTHLNGGTLPSGSYLVTNDITVSGANVLSNSELQMAPGVKITVPSGQALVLGNSHLYACGLVMWQGIELQDGSFFTNNGYNLVEDAEVAFDVPNTSVATTQNPQLMLNFHNMIFNKNYISLRIRNADPNITNFPLSVQACVFTSRNLPFTSCPTTLTWPNSSIIGTGLRVATSSTTGLNQPYNLQNYPMANLKFPHNNIPGYIGIKIDDVGSAMGAPNPGVVIGATTPLAINDPTIFNLFDNLGKGIEVTDASLTTMNNVFQNLQNFLEGGNWSYGRGIHHSVTGLMNARLDLGPFSGANQTTDLGNRFWDCWIAVWTDNVYQTDIEYNIFRSRQNYGTGFGPGADGILLFTNRFENNIRFCEFNNLHFAVHVSPHGGQYNVGGSSSPNGVYAGNTRIEENYFGPEVNSSIPIGTEFLHHGIRLTGQNALGVSWQVVGNAKIISNKLDRVYRGIRVDLMPNYPVEIGGNEILIKDDNFVHPVDAQFGIYAHDNQGELIINQNLATGQGVSNNRVKLIRVADHASNGVGQYPQVTLNEVTNAYKGFAFEGFQPNTRWECNTLTTPINYGFALEHSNGIPGVIGQQGGPCMESGNEYLPPPSWQSPNFLTYCDGPSNPAQSPLYVALFMTSFMPPPHATGGGPAYTNTGTFVYNFLPNCNPSPVNDCPPTSTYPSVPSQRNSAATGFGPKQNLGGSVAIYPNPSSGAITISGFADNQKMNYKIWDISGKLVQEKEILTSGTDVNLDLDLQKGIYLLEIKSDRHVVTREKLIIE